MGIVFADCPVHGRVPCEGLVAGSGNVVITNCLTYCPVSGCNRTVAVVEGTYEFADNILKNFRAVSRSDLVRLQSIASQAKSGTITHDQANLEVAQLDSRLVAIWNWANQNGAALAVLLTILTIFFNVYTYEQSDQSSQQQHRDSLSQLEAVGSAQQAILSEQQMLQRMYEALQRLPDADGPLKHHSQTGSLGPRKDQSQKLNLAVTANRHERRKAASLSRKGRDR